MYRQAKRMKHFHSPPLTHTHTYAHMTTHMTYRIAGKFGGNYIWRFGLQPLKLNIWWNLNLAICDCEAKCQYVILVCGYDGS